MTEKWKHKAISGDRNKALQSGVAGLLLAASVFVAGCGHPAAPPAGPRGPLPVTVYQVEPTNVPLTGEWVGILDGFTNAQIQPQATGYLVKQLYKEGSVVSQGQILFEIDPRPFRASLDSANAQLGQSQGSLAQAQAALGLAQINVNRDTPLAAAHAIAQSTLDNDTQQKLEAEANVATAQAAIKSAQATIETAKLNLGFTQVRSLISGIAGVAAIQVGSLVNTSSVLTSVSKVDPIKCYFSISDSEYLGLVNRAKNKGADLLHGESALPLTLSLADGSVYPHKGHILFVDRELNAQTGAIRIAAVFPNPGGVLRPNQFGRVKADTEVRQNALLVPSSAVQELQGLEQVYVVGSDNKAHLTTIQLGPQVGSSWLVNGGLQPGAMVVMDNIQKLQDGAPVSPHVTQDDEAPTVSAAPSAGNAPAGGK
jgi:membrane fusion protein (multidrug efflux system)